ncbi:EamA family transporter [Pseudidiomarina aquimaris]|uniref:EamA family transporter n=1 Tax=Pseudidiomarina aquimaris TaxID=641841 RepID=A0A432XFB6_9GAMM|nr:DMT family transporter [Pseudidiomarina aquimaris]RUO47247.1 EamA family transporter [Pseudidiomarina aquimaris]
MQLRQNAYFWALLAVTLWSTVATAFKLALDHLQPTALVVYATTLSALALVATCAFQGKLSACRIELKKRPLFYLFTGIINPVGYYLVLFSAYDLLPGSQAQPINYTWAISLTILSVVFLGRTLRKVDVVACFLGYTGVLIVATQGNITDCQFDSAWGVLLALISTFLWSAYWIINARSEVDSTVSLTNSFVVATLLLWLVLGHTLDSSALSVTSFGAVLYIGLFEMGITFLFWSKAMRLATNTAIIANLIFLSPFVSLWLLHVIRGEVIYPSTILGLSIIVCALLIQRFPRARSSK